MAIASPIPVAILLGFSTTGKSTISRAFESLKIAGALDVYDTDKMIGSAFGGHIYNVYLSLVTGSSTAPAITEIDRRERDFLSAFSPTRPSLIVAGPHLVIRPGWGPFMSTWRPVGFYLTITANDVYDGLMHRYIEEHAEVGHHPAFGSWNDGVTTQYNSMSSHWELLPAAVARANIPPLMVANVAQYTAAATQTFPGGPALRASLSDQARIVQEIRLVLGV